MAPKRARGSSSSQSIALFVDDEAASHYTKVSSRNLVKERGINISRHLYPPIADTIEARQWTKFTAQPSVAVVPVVREFYANALKHKDYSVVVRGISVSFASEAINELYELPNIENDEHSALSTDGFDADELLQVLCSPGAQFKWHNGAPLSFPKSKLNPLGRLWLHFVCGKLLPGDFKTDVSADRGLLLYCIITGKSIDVGKVIQHSISYSINPNTTGGLTHPSLITELCRKAGVPIAKTEETERPRSAVSATTLKKIRLPQVDNAPSLEERVSLMEREVQAHRRHFDGFAGNVTQYMNYSCDFNASLAQMFSSCGLNTGENAVQFPQPPQFQPYPPEEVEEEESEDSDA
jgi:hypothetical protein